MNDPTAADRQNDAQIGDEIRRRRLDVPAQHDQIGGQPGAQRSGHMVAVRGPCAASRIGVQHLHQRQPFVTAAIIGRARQGRRDAAQDRDIGHRPVAGKGHRGTRLGQTAAQIGIAPARGADP